MLLQIKPMLQNKIYSARKNNSFLFFNFYFTNRHCNFVSLITIQKNISEIIFLFVIINLKLGFLFSFNVFPSTEDTSFLTT